MAHLADAVGAKEDAAALRERSRNYRNVIDARTGFARPRFKDGSWWKDYDPIQIGHDTRSEEHTSELQALMRNSYAAFCLKIKHHKNSVHNQQLNPHNTYHNLVCRTQLEPTT